MGGVGPAPVRRWPAPHCHTTHTTHHHTTHHHTAARMPEKTQGFTEDQVEDFKEVFQLFDTKGDGLIQVSQVGDVLRALGQNPTEGDVKKLVQSTKSGGGPDSRVTFETFLPLLQAVSGKKMSEEEVEQLIHGKEDSQGNINYEEFVKMVLAQKKILEESENYARDKWRSLCPGFDSCHLS